MVCFKISGAFTGLKKVHNSFFNNIISEFFVNDEEVVACYCRNRVGFVLTTKRIIAINRKGLLGRNNEITSIPYNKITSFYWEAKGSIIVNAKLELYLDKNVRARFEFIGNKNIIDVYTIISTNVLVA